MPGPIGVVGDRWLLRSLAADLGNDVIILSPENVADVEKCDMLLLHTSWPDRPSKWEGQLLPTFGRDMKELIARARGRRNLREVYVGHEGTFSHFTVDAAPVPIAFWDMEGGNPSVAGVFDHFREVAAKVFCTAGAGGIYCPMAASRRLFSPTSTSPMLREGVLFPGRWYADHPGRCRFLLGLRARCVDMGIPFHITAWASKASWPEEFHEHLIPPVEFESLSGLYHEYRLVANHNLWDGGWSMRRPGIALSNVAMLETHGDLDLYEDEEALEKKAALALVDALRDDTMLIRINDIRRHMGLEPLREGGER